MPSLWPHIWAVPLVFAIGFAAGWGLRASIGESSGPGRPHDLDE